MTIGLVQGNDGGPAGQLELGEQALHRRHLVLDPGVARVHDVDQQIGFGQLLQRGLERGHQLMRELADEADGVGEDERGVAGRADQPCRRIQRDEEPIRGDPPGSRQLIEQGGLAGVGVADEGDHRIAGGLAAVAHEPAMHPHPLELLAELLDAVADDPAVRLELGLAGSPGPDAAAQPLEVLPLPDQPRQQIRELGQLDLELALHGRARAGRRCPG